ncbi:MAG: hypothetical protein ACE1ZA_12210, partial [Pseudomonadales bacterium]
MSDNRSFRGGTTLTFSAFAFSVFVGIVSAFSLAALAFGILVGPALTFAALAFGIFVGAIGTIG